MKTQYSVDLHSDRVGNMEGLGPHPWSRDAGDEGVAGLCPSCKSGLLVLIGGYSRERVMLG